MKVFSIYLLVFLITVGGNLSYSQQPSSCTNLDFELGNFVGWTGRTGSCCPVSMFANGIVTGQHTIMSGAGFDPHSNNQIPVVAPGGTYSARLGNDQAGSQAEQLSYSFQVTPQTELFIYRYAVVLEDPVHDPSEQPRFEIRVFDQAGNPVGCGTYNVVSGAGIPGFQTWFDPNIGSDIHFKTWTTVGIELSSYMGQTVTIEFSTGDCSLGAHFGYAYVDAYCSPMTVTSDYCPGSSTALLIAPPGFASYLWSNGATSQTITINNPVIGATYSVQMTSVTGCIVTLNQVIAVTQLFSNFNFNPGCESGTQFFDSSYVLSGSPVNQWLWDFGDGTTATMQNPWHQFPSSGNYNVTLTATNAGGCTKSITKLISILPSPVSDFTFIPGCPNQAVTFNQNTSFPSGTITSYEWLFGDGQPTSSVPNPSHSYSGMGPYDVSLIVTGDNGCADTIVKPVAPMPAPVAGFTFSVQCMNNTVSFTDVSQLTGGTITAWQWDFGDGSPLDVTADPVHVYNGGGNYSVQLIVTGSNGCTDTITKGVAMASLPTAAFTNSGACESQFTAFNDASSLTGGSISSWLWYFGDGTNSTLQNPFHQYSTTGSYNISLVVLGDNGCRDSMARSITVKPSPVASFTSMPVCPGQQAQFNSTAVAPAGTTINSWIWNFGDGSAQTAGQNVNHTYTGTGTYAVMSIVGASNGCIDSVVNNISTSITPVSKFSAPSGCALVPLSFSSTSTISSGTIIGWDWDFGDGTAHGNTATTTHSYAAPGSYNAYLTVTSNNGCTHTVLHEVSVSGKPIPSFTNSSSCVNDRINLNSISTSTNGSINYLKWDFGDGTFLTGADSVYHVYTDTGFVQIGLIVGNTLGCSDTVYRQVYIKPLPVAGFRWDEMCQSAPGSFYDTSALINGSISGWLWDFGSGTANIANPQFAFANYGVQPITLTVTGNNNCKATISQNIIVQPKPLAQFVTGSACINTVQSFQNTSNIPSGNIVSWQWNFGDGHTTATQHGQNTFTLDGYYQVQLIATSDFACKDTALDTVRVFPLPVANFFAPHVCLGNATLFNDLSLPVSDSLISWSWNFGDNTTSTIQSPSHIFLLDTIYTVSLTVQNEGFCSKTIAKNVIIRPLPDVGFIFSNPCVGSPVQFQDTSALAGYNINWWKWNFGDSTSASIASPLHTFLQSGNVFVKLIVRATNGCSDSVSVPVLVNHLPDAAFSVNDICEQTILVPNNQSTLSGGSIANTFWQWGDNSIDSIFSPTHVYQNEGSYNINLEVTGSNGCKNDTTIAVIIHDKPIATFTHSNACQLAPVAFFDQSSTVNDSLQIWQWQFGDGDQSALQNPVHDYGAYGVYYTELVVTNSFGCSDTVADSVTVAPKPQAAFSALNVCKDQPMIFNNSSNVVAGSIVSNQWHFGDGSGSSVTNPAYTFSGTGDFEITLVVTTANQCVDSIKHIYRVYQLPEAGFIADTVEGCQPLWVLFSDSSVTNEGVITKWNWDFGNGIADTLKFPAAVVYDQAGYFSPVLFVETDLGCRDTFLRQDYLHVFAKPEASFVAEPLSNTILHPLIEIKDRSWNAVSWFYDFGDTTNTTEQNPSHWYNKPEQYTIVQYIESADGCKDTALVSIEIKDDFTFYMPNSFTPNDDGFNETLNAYGIGIVQFHIQVFNRWGQLLFTSNDLSKGWDGTYLGNKVQQGVYIYKATVRDLFSKQHFYVGNINLIR
jgi:gliding motility-associated-like protein